MYELILDVRYLARKVETTHHYNTEITAYEKAADSIMSCFRVCSSDGLVYFYKKFVNKNGIEIS